MPLSPDATGRNKTKPWGFWATIGFSAIIFSVFSIVQFLGVLAFLLITGTQNSGIDIQSLSKDVSSNGFCIAICTIASGLISTPLILLFARLRKRFSVKDYLGLRKASKKEWIKWLLYLGIFLASSDILTLILNRPVVPHFMLETYRTAYFLPVLLFAIIIVAPIFEEIFFRGFLFQGITYLRFGATGAIVLTSLVWSVIHLQYDAYGMMTIFALGLLLGIARLKTDSIFVPIGMHSLSSLVAIIETAVQIQFLS